MQENKQNNPAAFIPLETMSEGNFPLLRSPWNNTKITVQPSTSQATAVDITSLANEVKKLTKIVKEQQRIIKVQASLINKLINTSSLAKDPDTEVALILHKSLTGEVTDYDTDTDSDSDDMTDENNIGTNAHPVKKRKDRGSVAESESGEFDGEIQKLHISKRAKKRLALEQKRKTEAQNSSSSTDKPIHTSLIPKSN